MSDNSSDSILNKEILTQASQAVAKHFEPIADEAKKGYVTKPTISKEIDGIAAIMADAMDAVDGKKDKVVHPKVLVKELEAALQSPEMQKLKSDPQILELKNQIEEYKKVSAGMPESLSVDEVREKIAKSMRSLNDRAFEDLDKDRDGKITGAEFVSGVNAKLPKSPNEKSSPERG